MASYFEDFNISPLADGQGPDQLLNFLRFIIHGGYWTEIEDDVREMLGETTPPTSKQYVKNLKEDKITKKEGKCPVCLKEWSIDELTITLECKHTFHSTCILPWLNKTNSCPLCRYEMPTDDELFEEMKKQKKRNKEREEDIETLHNSMYS